VRTVEATALATEEQSVPASVPPTAAAGSAAAAARTPDAAVVQELVTTHLPLVGHLAREVSARLPRHLDTDDLIGAGSLALVQAARTFDAELGVPFARFANTRIRGAMLDHMRQRDWATRSLRSRARMIAEVTETLTTALHRNPTETEIAAASGLAEAEVRQVRHDTDRAALLSLDPLAAGEDGIGSTLADGSLAPDETLVAAERMGYLRDALAELPVRQRAVVVGYYLDQRPLTEVAEELGVTQSRASQLRAEGLDLLHEALATLLHEDARAAVPAAAAAPEGRPGDGGADDGVRARRRAAYVKAVAHRSPVRARADVQAYLDGAALGTGPRR